MHVLGARTYTADWQALPTAVVTLSGFSYKSIASALLGAGAQGKEGGRRTLGKSEARPDTLEWHAFPAAMLKSLGFRVQVMAVFSPIMPASVARSQK